MANSPTERWFINLKKLQDCMKNLNHLTDDRLKEFSKQTLGSLITSNLIKGNLSVCCQNKGIGLVPDSVFADMDKNFFFFLETIGLIPIETSLRFQIYAIAVKQKPDLINNSVAQVMRMTLDEVFGNTPLNSNIGKKELDLTLNQITPDEFYPADGSFLNDGSIKLTNLVKKIIS
jgi:hypothetical protein